jgi:hypothetical protein
VETQQSPPGAALPCPYCRHDLLIPDNVWFYTCDHCRESLDIKAQFAFLRGMGAFDEGQDLMVSEGPRKPRGKTRVHPVYKQVIDLFIEAYSALQVAFQGQLAEVQRQVGVEMMASMAAEFFLQNFISPLEMNYWGLIMREQKTRADIDRLKQSTRDKATSVPVRILGTLRIRQLKRKLPELDQKIKMVESQIAFVDVPHARDLRWKP